MKREWVSYVGTAKLLQDARSPRQVGRGQWWLFVLKGVGDAMCAAVVVGGERSVRRRGTRGGVGFRGEWCSCGLVRSIPRWASAVVAGVHRVGPLLRLDRVAAQLMQWGNVLMWSGYGVFERTTVIVRSVKGRRQLGWG